MAPIDSTSTSHAMAKMSSPLMTTVRVSKASEARIITALPPTYCHMVAATRSPPDAKRFCQIVPALMPSTEMKDAVSVAAVTPPPSAPSFGHSTITTPIRPTASPAQWRGRMASPRILPASTAVISGCRPTIRAESPAGMPRWIAQKTAPR